MPKFVLGGGSNIVLTGDVKPLVLKVEVHGPPAAGGRPAGHGGRGRRRRELARLRDLDAGPGLSGPGEPGADPGHRGRFAGAEHRRLRRRTAGPLRVAGRHRPVDRQDLHAGRGAVRLRLPRFGVQARGRRSDRRLRPGRPGADPAGALSPAQALEAGAGLPGPGAQDARDRHPRSPRRGRSTTGSAPSAAPSCPTRG